MKNRKSLYILVPLVVVVWGLLFWKVFWSSSTSPVEVKPTRFLEKSARFDGKEEDRVLILNYQDPFLKEQRTVRDAVPVTSPEPLRQRLNRVPMWPEIYYFGLVKNRSETGSLALLEINGRRCFVREGETVDVVKCLAIHADSIGVQLNNEQKYIERSGSRQSDFY